MRPLVHRDFLDQPQRIELHDRDRVLAAHRDVRVAAVLRQRHLVGILAERDLRRDFPRSRVDHLKVPGAIAADVDLRPVGRRGQPVRPWIGGDAPDFVEAVGVDLDELIRIAERHPEGDVRRLGEPGERCRPQGQAENKRTHGARSYSPLRPCVTAGAANP
jgi:hypothetical protein